jgi:hypothetical protein
MAVFEEGEDGHRWCIDVESLRATVASSAASPSRLPAQTQTAYTTRVNCPYADMLPATPLPKSVGQCELANAQLIVGMKTGDADFGNFPPALRRPERNGG